MKNLGKNNSKQIICDDKNEFCKKECKRKNFMRNKRSKVN